MTLLENLILLVKQNQFVAGSLSFWALTLVGDFLKAVPIKMYTTIKNQVTTTVSISNYDKSFYDFLEWYEKNKYKKYSRTLKLTNGKWGFDDKGVLSAGLGLHFFIWDKTFFYFSVTDSTNSGNSDKDKQNIVISFIGRDSSKMLRFISEIAPKKAKNDDVLVVNKYADHWIKLTEEPKRMLDSISINEDSKNKLISHIDNFYKNKDFYLKNGIPYRTCILLHGPPGTGKTSIIKAIASEYDKQISLIDIDTMSGPKIKSALCQASDNCIIAIEDVDSASEILTRTKENETINFSAGGISGFLNAFDGIGTFSNKIIIMTTNHLEKLDPAILRPGRVDLILKIDLLESDSIKQYLNRFFKDVVIPDKVLQPISGCKLQQLILESDNDFERLYSKLQ